MLTLLSLVVQLTETSSRYNRKISGTTALQEALKEKQQHIEQLMAERDMERAEVTKATSHVGEMEQEIGLLRGDQEQVSILANKKLQRISFPKLPINLCSIVVRLCEDGDKNGSAAGFSGSCRQRESGVAQSTGGGAQVSVQFETDTHIHSEF